MGHSKQPAKLAMLVVLSLLLLLCVVGNVHCAVHENSQDFHSLLNFKQAIDDQKGALLNWNPNTHFCRWYGVNCSSTPPYRVTTLNLTGQSLTGTISSSLGNLTFLKGIFLDNNYFHGSIPPLNLQYLEALYLRNNLLQDVIPDALANCSNLAFLYLDQNHLTGAIPPTIGSLSKLIALSLAGNNITGFIPAILGNITTLVGVDFNQNQLSGRIPDKFWEMPSLKLLHVVNNKLSGEIPYTLSNKSSLTELHLASNMFGNALPSNIGDNFPNLKTLYLGNNSFTGQIPASLGNAPKLGHIDLSCNKFTGQIPSSFGRLAGLYSLSLGGNMVEASDSGGWEFLHALSNCASLDSLSLSNNLLRGVIPDSIAYLPTSLTRLYMGGNQLSGIVPSSIGNFSALIEVTLDQNNLTGRIEEWVGKLANLQHLNLENNNFIGTLPPSISNLTKLAFLSLAKNNFTGFIPPMGNFPQMNTLNLSYNNFQGSIPDMFGNLKQLVTLDISHNNLSGSLPTCLNDLHLSKLDLSYNNFQGEIPTTGVFNNDDTKVSLDGNPGLCGGAMDLHMRPCQVASRRGRVVNYLIKILIPVFGFMSLMLLVYFLVLEKKTSRRADTSQLTFGEHFEKVTYNDLVQATRDFSEANLIGRGSYGSVYSGKLKESKMEVAVKVFNLEMRGAERSFMSECEALRSIQHRNLLPIITACSTVDNEGNVFKALIYELMPNGNLDTWLHHKEDVEAPKRLSLTQRISIAINIADALDYLHHDCGRPTVHCDLKPSNILLDDDMYALLGDFGIARFYVDPRSTDAGSVSSIGLKGTIGYIPPEYGGGGHASTCGDVYSFGVLLLEILTSKRPTDPMFMDGLDIISFVESSFPDQIFHVIDAHLVEECNQLSQEKKVTTENEIYQCLEALLQVALSCTRSLPSERSNMKQVASKMHAIKTSHLRWKDK